MCYFPFNPRNTLQLTKEEKQKKNTVNIITPRMNKNNTFPLPFYHNNYFFKRRQVKR
jgi:homogentisate 1,2-dioxygenase